MPNLADGCFTLTITFFGSLGSRFSQFAFCAMWCDWILDDFHLCLLSSPPPRHDRRISGRLVATLAPFRDNRAVIVSRVVAAAALDPVFGEVAGRRRRRRRSLLCSVCRRRTAVLVPWSTVRTLPRVLCALPTNRTYSRRRHCPA